MSGILEEDLYEIRPLLPGQFNGRDHPNQAGNTLPEIRIFSDQQRHEAGLDFFLDLLGQSDPDLGIFSL